MTLRRLLLLSLLLAAPSLRAEDGISAFAGPEADAEAARLFARADNYVRNVTEGAYSYAYIQFHWKRAGANLDRVAAVYPSSPTARKLAAGELKVGSFEPGYFRTRVLPRLEEKKVAAFDAVNCAIFLYGLETNTDAAGRKRLLQSIVETLCRQIRWSEALAFPVLEEDQLWLWNIVLRQAATYRNDRLAEELVGNTRNEEANHRLLLRTQAEGLGFRGETAEALEEYLSAHAAFAPELRAAAFRGAARRQQHIDRARQQGRPLQGLYDGVDGIQQPDQAFADLHALYRTFGATPPDEARAAYARYHAFLGRFDDAAALAPESAYAAEAMDWLVEQERPADASRIADRHGRHAELAFLLARAGLDDEAERLVRGRGAPADLVFAAFRGRLHSTANRLEVRERTFVETGLDDPNLTGRLICEWSLTPNRALRGAAPWDAVVGRFAPGFDNLPEPKDQAKVDAARR